MPYHIVKRGTKFVVEKADGSRTIGTHDTEAEAKRQMAALYANEPRAAEARHLHLLGATSQARTEMWNDREYLVVPCVSLMEGVIHAVNAQTPEFVPFSTLEKAAASWDGKPVTLGHPKKDGKQCSASSPDVLEAHGIGVIRNSRVDATTRKMLQEAWIEKARARKLHPEMFARLEANKQEEVSVGAFVVTDGKEGRHTNGRDYKASWTEASGDHLAFLPGGRGACSVEMGCGAHRAAMRVCGDVLELEILGSLADKAQVEVGGGRMRVGTKVKVDKPGHAAHGKAGTITASKDGKHTVGSHGSFLPTELRAAQNGDTPDTPEAAASEEAAELITYNTMRTLMDGCGDQWDEASGLIDELIADETENPTETDAEEEAEEDLETARLDAIRALCQSMIGSLSGIIGATYAQSLTDAPRFMGLAGARHSATDMKAIQAVHDHSMALGAQCDRGNYKAMEEAPKKTLTEQVNNPTHHYIERVRREAGVR